VIERGDSFLDWALRYRALGWPVFPLAIGGKVPIIPESRGGRGCNDATLNESQIREWWTRWPKANIGLATGHGWFVVDADIKHGGDETWDMLRMQHGKIPDTPEQETGTGGRHILFQMPAGIVIRNSQGKVGPGIDIRGTGGYIVAEPSIHPETKRRYAWDPIDCFEESKLAPAPDWLVKKILDAQRRGTENKPTPNLIPEGGRNDALFRVACRLRRSALAQEEIFASLKAVNQHRCKPPLPDDELRTIARSAARYSPDKKSDVFQDRGAAPAGEPREDAAAPSVLSQREVEEKIQAAIDADDPKAAVDLAAHVAKLKKHAQALVTAKLKAHFAERFPIDQFEAVLATSDADESELSQEDVEEAARAAIELNDLKAAIELAPHVAKLPKLVQNLITMRFRTHFGDRFPTKNFEAILRDAERKPVFFSGPPGGGSDSDTAFDGPDLTGDPLTDSGNGERFVRMFGHLVRYCIEMEKWLVWDGKRWSIDDRKHVTQLAKRTARRLYEQALQNGILEKWARKSESAAGIEAMLKRAATEPGIPISASELDQHPYLLNCPNGVVDLRSGQLLDHDKKYMITKLCPIAYDPEAKAERFLQFVHWAMGDTNPDAEPPARTLRLVSFLQRIFGYSLTGDVSAKCVFIFYGHTANNGKTTLVNVFKDILGADYAVMLNIKSIMTARGNEAGSDLADLRGARFASASESQDGDSFNDAILKYITAGGGEIKARRLYENFIRFPQTHHLFIDTNHRPRVKGSDKGIWDRLKLIPFDSRVEDSQRDPDLKDKLVAEASGILAWAVRGAMDWIERKRLEEPEEVMSEVRAWQESDDPLREFLDDCCEISKDPDTFVRQSQMSAAYMWWCKQNSERFPIGRSSFRERMLNKGFEESRGRRDHENHQLRTWEGIELKDEVLTEVLAFESKRRSTEPLLS